MGKGKSGGSGSRYSTGAGKGFGNPLYFGIGNGPYKGSGNIPPNIRNAFMGAYGRNPAQGGRQNYLGQNQGYNGEMPQLSMNIMQYSGKNGEKLDVLAVSYSGNDPYSPIKANDSMKQGGYLGRSAIEQAIENLQKGKTSSGSEDKQNLNELLDLFMKNMSNAGEGQNKEENCPACGKPRAFCSCLYSRV